MRTAKATLDPKKNAKHPQLSGAKFSPRERKERQLSAKEEKLALDGFSAIRRLGIDWDVKKAAKALNALLRKGLNPETKFQESFGKIVKDTAKIEFYTGDTIFSIVAETLIPLAIKMKREDLLPALEAIGDSVFPNSLNVCKKTFIGSGASLDESFSERKGRGPKYAASSGDWTGAREPSPGVRRSRNFDFD